MVHIVVGKWLDFTIPGMVFDTFKSLETWLGIQLEQSHQCSHITNTLTGHQMQRQKLDGNDNQVPESCCLTWGTYPVVIQNNSLAASGNRLEQLRTISRGPLGTFTDAKPFPACQFALFVIDAVTQVWAIIPVLLYPSLHKLAEQIQHHFNVRLFYLGNELGEVLDIPFGKSYVGSSCPNRQELVERAEKQRLVVKENSTVYMYVYT